MLKLAPEAQAALDLAKRALPEGQELSAGLLLASLYHAAELSDDFPELASRLDAPQPLRDETPERVPVAKALRRLLGDLALRSEPISGRDFFEALRASDVGQRFLSEAAESHADPAGPGAVERQAPASDPDGGIRWRDSEDRRGALEALRSFGRMLTEGEPPHGGGVEMENTLRSLVRTLVKHRRRNAILLGQPGTGKSAAIYELARRIVRADSSLPERIRELDLFELSPSFLRSGASMVGQYDERVKALLQILLARPNIVLFVDEIHSLFQSGVHERGPFSDANESFKGVLGRGEITCLGCTTPSEYRHFIEPDPALARRFSVIRIDPPSREATLRILAARKRSLEDYYKPLRIGDALLARAVALSDEYLPSRFQPDKSIQLLDEACAHCVTEDPPLAELSEGALWTAVEDMVGHGVARPEKLTVEDVLAKLKSKIVGQDEVLEDLARAFVSGLGSWTAQSGPRGVFLFCGPTGVGKTEAAMRLAEILGGGREAVIEVNCNTLQGSGQDAGPAINVLLGPPPGYVGYARGQGGVLSAIRDQPESVVLFDEIEKADPGVAKVLLQILDEGRVEDSEGNPLDFRRAFIVFTTNAGSVYDAQTIGFERDAGPVDVPHANLDVLKAELRGLGFGEEFLGRIRHFFVFDGLDTEEIRILIEQQLEKLRGAAELRGHALDWEPETVDYLASAWQPRFGVRHLLTILRNRIVEHLSVAEAQGELRGVERIILDVLGGKEQRALGLDTGVAQRRREEATLRIQLS